MGCNDSGQEASAGLWGAPLDGSLLSRHVDGFCREVLMRTMLQSMSVSNVRWEWDAEGCVMELKVNSGWRIPV